MGEIIPRPQPPQALAFDGERFTTSFGGQTAIEHWHRYLLARELVRDQDVLDIACGEGYGSALLAQTARTVTGVDLSATAIGHAQGSYARPNLRYLEGDALANPMADGSVGVVVSFETLEHFREQDRFLQEVKRVLRSDGLLLISTPDRDNYSPSASPANPYHRLELTADEFHELLRRHFAAIRCQRQRVLLGSALLGDGLGSGVPLCFERRGEGHFEASAGMARGKYLIAMATDGSLPALPDSIYVDLDQLAHVDGPMLERLVAGHPSPQAAARISELEARVEDLERVLRQRDEALAGQTAEAARLARELPVAQQDIDRLAGELTIAQQDIDRLAGELDVAEQERQRLDDLLESKILKKLIKYIFPRP